MRAAPARFSDREREDIRLRRAAGQTIAYIAKAYGYPRHVIKNLFRTAGAIERQRYYKQQYKRKLAQIRFNDAGKAAQLRKQMAEEYERRTGCNLLADLKVDALCLSRRNSSPPPETNTAIKRRSSSGLPYRVPSDSLP